MPFFYVLHNIFDSNSETIEQLRRENDQEMTQAFLDKLRVNVRN